TAADRHLVAARSNIDRVGVVAAELAVREDGVVADWSSPTDAPSSTEYYPSGPVTGFDQAYSIFRDLIKLESADNSFTARWELDGNRLRFSDVSGPPGD